MRSVFFASLRIHARRYVSASIAVAIAVAFVVAIGMLNAGARAGLMASEGAPYRGADHVVVPAEGGPSRGPACCPDTLDRSAAIEFVERYGSNASALGRVLLPVRGDGGRRAGSRALPQETAAGPVAAAQALRWQRLVAGRFPERLGEAVVHVWDAQRWELAVGDRIRIGEGASASDLQVTGLVESPTTWTQASIYVAWPQYLRWRDHPSFHVGSIAVRGAMERLPEGMAAHPAEQYVTSNIAKLNNNTDTFGLLLLLFASVALFVSVLVVANTFSILFAQRLRDFALLRCVGATRRQVLGSIRREAAAIGVLASLAGTAAGVGLGYGLIPLVNALAAAGVLAPPPAPPALWLLGGFLIGLAVTLAASWLPTRSAVRVSPLAALRPVPALDTRAPSGQLQVAFAALLLLVGLALLATAMARDSTTIMLAGGGSVFAAVLLVGPVVFPFLIRIVGSLAGGTARLATANAVRNPRRTATTASALMVGITLASATLTAMATWSRAMDEHRDTRLPIDVALVSRGEPFPQTLLEQVRRTRGVAEAIALDGVMAQVTGWPEPVPIVSAPAAEQVARDGGAFARVAPGAIRFDHDAFRSPRTSLSLDPRGTTTVRTADRELELHAVLLGGWGRVGIVAPETLARLTDVPKPYAIWIRAHSGADPLPLVDRLDALADAGGIDLQDHLQARVAGNRQLDILTWSVLGLLGVSVAIALVGIGNTLGLSVLERVREHALLRALGVTRGQLRRMLAVEAILLSAAASLLGTSIGVAFAWVAHETFIRRVLGHAAVQIPWLQLTTVVLLTVVAGLLASILPARRAARVTPATGLMLGL